ncbi:MAG TPA: UPF0280 family protein [Desulfobulbus sp.]|nr:UPF0280 family protein [Desulfobulbus sp.]
MKRRTRRRKNPGAYRERSYRRLHQAGLVASEVRLMETDLHILATAPVEDRALVVVTEVRRQLEEYIAENPVFLESLVPLPMDGDAPPPVRDMLRAAAIAGVGPMAAVAGVIAEAVGVALLRQGLDEVIVENGGDLFVGRNRKCRIGIYAGESVLSGRVGLLLQPGQMPCGVCTSSGSVGHSLSMGAADAVVVRAASTPLADAAATRLGNEVSPRPESIDRALAVARTIEGIAGVVIVSGDRLGAWGDVELVRL